MSEIGTVVALWRYPVKSMMGEELNAAEVGARGLAGDRGYALLDRADGKVASAKNPRKWPRLFDFRAALANSGAPPEVLVTLPDGALVRSSQPDAGAILSRALGREVDLSATPPSEPALEEYWPDLDGLAYRETVTDERIAMGTPGAAFFDSAPIHLLTTATLEALQSHHVTGRWEARRFRPNFVIQTGQSGFVENDWVGRVVRLGGQVRLQVTNPCPRCVMTTLAQGDLPQDAGVLRTIVQHNRVLVPVAGQALPSVGVYATVLSGGVVRRGDAVAVE